jgi:hypothetical protein
MQGPSSSSSTASLLSPQQPGTPWQRSRLWVAPPLSAMALPVSAGSLCKGALAVAFDCPLGPTGRLAYLWDHQVAGQMLLPGAAVLEMAAAAATACWMDSTGRSNSSGSAEPAVAVTAAAILAPVVLERPTGRGQHSDLLLRCSIDCVGGSFKVRDVTCLWPLRCTAAAACIRASLPRYHRHAG